MNCNHCGTTLPEGVSVCTVCGTPVETVAAGPEIQPVRENVAMGILGAIGGALIGGASIILLSRLGFIAAISGFLIAFFLHPEGLRASGQAAEQDRCDHQHHSDGRHAFPGLQPGFHLAVLQ